MKIPEKEKLDPIKEFTNKVRFNLNLVKTDDDINSKVINTFPGKTLQHSENIKNHEKRINFLESNLKVDINTMNEVSKNLEKLNNKYSEYKQGFEKNLQVGNNENVAIGTINLEEEVGNLRGFQDNEFRNKTQNSLNIKSTFLSRNQLVNKFKSVHN